jgi:hypothetical protein
MEALVEVNEVKIFSHYVIDSESDNSKTNPEILTLDR